MEQRVSVEVREGIGYVTLTRPEKRNGLDLDMLEAIVKSAKQIGKDRDVRAVILRGDGPAFCAGLNFASVGTDPVRMMKSFLKRSPDSVAATKALFHKTWRASPQSAFGVESSIQRKLLLGKNHQIARKANQIAETPRFKPRTFGQ